MQYLEKIVINDKYEFDCFVITMMQDTFEATLDTTDYATVKEALDDIKSIDIYDSTGFIRSRITDYNSYSSITYMVGCYQKEVEDKKGNVSNTTVDTIRVVFKKTSIEDKINELEKKINYTIDESAMNLDEYREYRVGQLGDECRKAIYAGLDIETSLGKQHFTYNAEDQVNIKTLFDAAMMTKLDVPYHQSKAQCIVYPWEDAMKIYVALQSNLLYHITYCNALNMYIREDICSKEEMAKVTYGQEVPESRKEDMMTALAKGDELIKGMLAYYGVVDKDEEVMPDGPESEVTE